MKKLLFIYTLLASIPSYAEDVTLFKGELITLSINEIDTIVDLPRPLRLIPETKNYIIEGIPATMDKEGHPMDFRSLRIKRARKNSPPEKIPLLMTEGININVQLVSTLGADRHYRLRLPRSATSFQDSNFMEKELQLMKHMLRDDDGNGFSRQRYEKELILEGYKDLKLKMVRRYKGNLLLGYVFKLINTSDNEVTIYPQALNFGTPNTAVALQYDHAKLKPCHINNSPNPKGSGCMTVIRLVVRGDNWQSPASQSAMPWQLGRKKG